LLTLLSLIVASVRLFISWLKLWLNPNPLFTSLIHSLSIFSDGADKKLHSGIPWNNDFVFHISMPRALEHHDKGQ
jgi:hypothetical protein